MSHPLLELGGSGALLHLAPANGFPPATYLPALEPLLGDYRVVSLPPRALWPGIGPPPPEPGSWTTLAEDLLAGIERHRLGPVIGVGHSFGAVASLIAAAREPARFRALVLLDPTIGTPAMLEEFRRRRSRGELGTRSLVEGALKRKARFESAAEAFDYWRGKPLFADWSDAVLGRYVDAMLVPDKAGGFRLSWAPEWEAWYYASFYTGTWQDVARLDPALPVLVVGGETSDTFLPDAAALFREGLPGADHVTVRGHGHLFPLAAPGETGEVIRRWLEGRGV